MLISVIRDKRVELIPHVNVDGVKHNLCMLGSYFSVSGVIQVMLEMEVFFVADQWVMGLEVVIFLMTVQIM